MIEILFPKHAYYFFGQCIAKHCRARDLKASARVVIP